MKMKRKLALLTSAVMLVGSFNFTTAFAAETQGSGDVDDDGSITETDADLVFKYVLNPENSDIATYKSLIAAEGNTAIDCDDADYTASDGSSFAEHGITAKDAAFILQQTMMSAKISANIKAGIKRDGANVFKPIGYDSLISFAEAQAAAQEEISTLTIQDYFDKYIDKVDDAGSSQVSRVNDFLNKVYINDWNLATSDGKAWVEAYLNVNDSTDNFFETAYTFCDIDGEGFNIEDAEDCKTLFAALRAITLTDADVANIKARMSGSEVFEADDDIPSNYAVGDTIPVLWLRTTFKVGVYDVTVDENGDAVSDPAVVYGDAMNDYRGTYSVVDWYYYNRAGASGTTEQYFQDNLKNIIDKYAVDVFKALNDNVTVKSLVDILGGDRIEVTINQSNLPDPAKHPGNYSTYQEFVDAMGDFSDPTNTYYFDFSEFGYFN